MFENLGKFFGVGASLAFLLSLTHESIFMFIIWADIVNVPYEVSDIVRLSAIMLPRILGVTLLILLFVAVLDNLAPKWIMLAGILAIPLVSLFGYYANLSLIVFSLLLIISTFHPKVLNQMNILGNKPLKSFLVLSAVLICQVVFSAIGDGIRANGSTKLVKVSGALESGDVFLLRSLSKGFLVRDTNGKLFFVSAEKIESYPLSSD